MKNLFKFYSLGFLILCSLLFSVSVFAEYIPPVYKAKVIADINVTDSTIVSEKDNVFNLSFLITNNENVQPSLKYGVNLIKLLSNGGIVVDKFISNEIFSVAGKTAMTKEFIYNAPKNLTGDYIIEIVLMNESGLTFGRGEAGKIKLVSSVKTIEILTETCSLLVVGEKGSPKYSLGQGVDIEQTEELSLNCSILNPSKESITVTPFYETHLRKISGEIVEQTGGDVKPITLKGEEKKSVSFVLSKATKPQAYDVKFSLKSGEEYSNSVVIHYVIRGISASVNNISLDKDYYTGGDTANMSISWTSSADGFMGNRANEVGTNTGTLSLSTIIKNDKGSNCSKLIVTPIVDTTSGGDIEIPISIKSKCKNPQVSVDLKNANGDILYHKELSFVSDPKSIPSIHISNFYKILIAIIAIVLAVYFINLNKKSQVKVEINKSDENTNIQ